MGNKVEMRKYLCVQPANPKKDFYSYLMNTASYGNLQQLNSNDFHSSG
jgi:hypothetical protein